MKLLLSTLILSFVFLSLALAQQTSSGDSLRVERQDPKAHALKSDSRKVMRHPAFRDENGNGIDDRSDRKEVKLKTQQLERKGSNVDCFIDIDGDGINDSRCGGMGIAPTMTSGKQKGK